MNEELSIECGPLRIKARSVRTVTVLAAVMLAGINAVPPEAWATTLPHLVVWGWEQLASARAHPPEPYRVAPPRPPVP